MSRDVVTPLYRALPDGAQGGAEVFVRTALVPLANVDFARRAPPLFVHEVLDNSVAGAAPAIAKTQGLGLGLGLL